MDFDLNDEQKEIKRVAHELLAVALAVRARCARRPSPAAYDPALWRELVELGWPGIAVSAEHGGQGLGAVELAVLLEELGYACAATPYLSTATAAAAIEAAGTPEQRSKWLPGARLRRADRRASARAELAADARRRRRDRAARRRRRRCWSSAPPPTSRSWCAIDPTRRFATVAGEGEPLGAGAADRIRTAIAAEVIGVCQRALEMTLEYVKDRKQFGVAVGSFQAVSHRCAQMLLAHREHPLGRLLRRVGGGRRPGPAAGGGGARRRGGRADGGREVTRQRDPGPRRHRLHVGGRRPLALQARPARQRAARRRASAIARRSRGSARTRVRSAVGAAAGRRPPRLRDRLPRRRSRTRARLPRPSRNDY